MKSPAFRFYPSDFLGSPSVALMDAAEVGAYILLLSFAWESDRHGYLPDNEDMLRRWSRLSREQWAQSRELLLGRFPVQEDGWRANPRMVAEATKQQDYSASRAKNGALGGRPRKHMVSIPKAENTGLQEGDGPLKPVLFDKNHMVSEAIHMPQKQKPSVSVSVSKKTKAPLAEDGHTFLVAWNNCCGSILPRALRMTPDRQRALAKRIAEGLTIEHFSDAVAIASDTPFCCGENERGWKVDIDFLLQSGGVTKIREGKYGSTRAQSEAVRPRVLTAIEKHRRSA